MSSRCRSRSKRSDGVNTLSRAAASSMARGSPSSRRQISAIVEALSSVTAKSGRTARARSVNRATASDSAMTEAGSSGWGRLSGGTGNTFSARTRRVSRLVTRTLIPGACWSSSDRPTAAAVTCSKLSRTSSIRESRSRVFSTSRASLPPDTGCPASPRWHRIRCPGHVRRRGRQRKRRPGSGPAHRRRPADRCGSCPHRRGR